jgi:rfaE bifunctional protein kinase chain/domain
MPDLRAIVRQFAGRRVLVVGDVILDEYLIGRAARLSREAPIPVLEFEERRLIPGGAANPAANIAAWGASAVLCGVIGADSEAAALRSVLGQRGIDARGLLVDAARPTTVKTRVMAQMGLRFPQQVARLDRLSRLPIDSGVESGVIALLERLAPSADALLLSDYHGGMLTPALVERLRRVALDIRRDTPPLLAADAQGELDKYARFAAVKCNADEARAFLRRDLASDDDFAAAAQAIRARLALTVGMFITRGGDGITLAAADDSVIHSPAPAVIDVYDTVGAGDTTIAMLTLALTVGATPGQAAALANAASGLVVQHVGNYAPDTVELIAALAREG